MAGLPRAHIHLRQVNEMEKSLWGKFPVERAEAYLYYIKGENEKARSILMKFIDELS